MDNSRYMLAGLQGETVVRLPGELDGNAFSIDRLVGCVVHILDHTAQVQVCLDPFPLRSRWRGPAPPSRARIARPRGRLVPTRPRARRRAFSRTFPLSRTLWSSPNADAWRGCRVWSSWGPDVVRTGGCRGLGADPFPGPPGSPVVVERIACAVDPLQPGPGAFTNAGCPPVPPPDRRL